MTTVESISDIQLAIKAELEKKSMEPDFYNDLEASVPNGENTKEFVTRVGTACNNVIKHMMTEGKTTAVVCAHGGVISTILAAYGLPQQSISDWECMNGKGYCILINPTIWMRGGMFEVVGHVPFEKDEEVNEEE